MLLDGAGGEKLLCEETEDGMLRLCRVFGSVDTLVLPDTLAGGRQIRTIGAYCFAEKGRLSQTLTAEVMEAGLGDGTTAPEGVLRPLNGNYLREITLPDTVTCLETYAFYNCRKLERLTVGAALTQVNSDAFMNCRALHTLVIRADAGEVTGLPFLLNQNLSQQIKRCVCSIRNILRVMRRSDRHISSVCMWRVKAIVPASSLSADGWTCPAMIQCLKKHAMRSSF